MKILNPETKKQSPCQKNFVILPTTPPYQFQKLFLLFLLDRLFCLHIPDFQFLKGLNPELVVGHRLDILALIFFELLFIKGRHFFLGIPLVRVPTAAVHIDLHILDIFL